MEQGGVNLLQKPHYSSKILVVVGEFKSSKRIEKAGRRITTGQLNKYAYILGMYTSFRGWKP